MQILHNIILCIHFDQLYIEDFILVWYFCKPSIYLNKLFLNTKKNGKWGEELLYILYTIHKSQLSDHGQY